MATAPLDDQDFEAKLALRLAQIRKESDQKAASISEEAVLWLALCPVWTPSLAEEAGFPAAPGSSVRDTLLRYQAAGICQRRAAGRRAAARGPAGAADVFWMSQSSRSEIRQRAITSRGRDRVIELLGRVGAQVATAKDALVPSLDVRRWAEIASEATPRPDDKREAPIKRAAEALIDRVGRELERGQPNEALRWIDAARSMEDLLGTWLTAAIGRAGRMVERHNRRADDEARLSHFFVRDEQIEPFRALMNDGGDAWALHYLGPGGVGKTMLMRHISARIAAQWGASVARIDFDYVNPDFPTRSPGLLLSLLAAELRLFDDDASGAATEAFVSFDLHALDVRERSQAFAEFDDLVGRTAGVSGGGQIDASEAIRGGALDNLVAAFVEAVRRLPQPLLLLLDTCEELAKHRTDARPAPNVEATFALLERTQAMLHARGRQPVRVVFCGRRPLASRGTDWHIRPAEGTSPLAERLYLRLHEVRGFTQGEARRFLAEHTARSSPALVEAVLRRSPAVGLASHIDYNGAPRAVGDDDRYNPIELARFADWIREEGDVEPDDLAVMDADRYVMVRIAGRLRSAAVREVLPLVGALGSLDAEMLRAAGVLDETSIAGAFDDLCHQEWISVRAPRLAEVEAGLAPRLREYAPKAGGPALQTWLARVAAHLEERTLTAPLATLDVAHFAIALRLARDPQRATAWWARVEARLTGEGAFDWARRLADRLLADPESLPFQGADHRRMAALLRATYSAALLHCPGAGTDTLWAEVAADAGGDDAVDLRLSARAAAGVMVTAWVKEQGIAPAQVQALALSIARALDGDLDEALAASLVAGVEAALELAERDPASPPPELEIVERLASKIGSSGSSRTLQAFSRALAARAAALAGAGARAFANFADAAGLSAALRETAPRWLDWIPPADISARVIADLARVLYPDHAPCAAVERQVQRALTPLQTPWVSIDVDRARSALRFLTSARDGSGEPGERPSPSGDAPPPARRIEGSTENAVNAFAPWAVEQCLAIAGRARIAEALEVLDELRLRAEKSALALGDVRATTIATLTVARRLRLWDEELYQSLGDERGPLELVSLRWALEGLHGTLRVGNREDQAGQRLAYRHALWRATGGQPLQPIPPGTLASRSFPIDAVSAPQTAEQAAALLDLTEAGLLGREPGLVKVGEAVQLSRARKAIDEFCKGARKVDAFTLQLRAVALFAAPSAHLEPLAEHLGRRRAGWIAFDEGELLALRLPGLAVALLNLAARWLRASRDDLGHVLALAAQAMTSARAGNILGCTGALAALHQAYGLVAGELALPSWGTIEELASSRVTAVWELPTHFRPWILRIAASLAWRNDQSGGSHALDDLHAEIGRRLALPFELLGWPRSPAPGAVPTPRPVDMAGVGNVIEGWEKEGARGGESQGAGIDPNAVSISFSVRSAARRRGPLLSWRTTFDCEIAVTPGGFHEGRVEYEELRRTGALPPPLEDAFDLSAVPDVGVVTIVLDSASGAPAWECALAQWLARSPVQRHSIPSMRFRRRPDALRGRRRERTSLRDGGCSVVQGSYQDELATLGWEQIRERWNVIDGIDRLKFGMPKAAIAHIIAEPFDTSRGARLAMRDEESAEQLSATRGDNIDVDRLLKLFPVASLIVLQLPPSRDLRWSDVRRDRASHLREIALELSFAGVPAVLTLPSLSFDVARRVLDQLATAVERCERVDDALIRDAAAVRQRIYDLTDELSPSDRLGLVMDVALYLDDLAPRGG